MSDEQENKTPGKPDESTAQKVSAGAERVNQEAENIVTNVASGLLKTGVVLVLTIIIVGMLIVVAALVRGSPLFLIIVIAMIIIAIILCVRILNAAANL